MRKKHSGHPFVFSTKWVPLIVMLALFLSKLAGQIRQILVGVQFGFDTAFADGFTQGFLIPDFIYVLLVGGSIQTAIVPYLSGNFVQNRAREAWKAVSSFLNTMILLMAALLILCEGLLPWLLRPFTSEHSFEIAVGAGRALLPQAFFMMLAGVLIGVLNANKRFIVTALTPLAYNFFLLLSLFFLGKPDAHSVVLSSWGITVGAVLFFLIQLFCARSYLSFYRPVLTLRDPETRSLFKLAFPTLISSALPYLSSFLISSHYEFFQDGTSYAYANAIATWQIPFGIVVIALNNILLPRLSEACIQKQYDEAGRLFAKNLRLALFLMVPAALLFCILNQDVVQAVFSWGSTPPEKLHLTAYLLAFYAFVLILNTIIFFLNNFFYANQQTRIPMMGSVLQLIVLFFFCKIFLQIPQLGPAAMVCAYIVAVAVNTLFLVLLRRHSFPNVQMPSWGNFALQMIFFSLFSGTVLLTFQYFTQAWQPERKLAQLLYLGLKAGVVYFFYFLGAWACNLKEIRELRVWIKRKKESRI